MPKVMSYKAGSIIFFAGDKDDRIFILQNGKVELSAVDIVSELEIKEQVKQGDFFGVKNALIKEQRTDTARAVTDCQDIALTPQEFEKSFSANREVMLKMLTSFNRSLRSLHYSTETLLKKRDTAATRVDGMFAIAKAYFNSERYFSAVYQCEKLLRDIHELANRDAITELLGEARVKASSQAEMELKSHSFASSSDDESKTIKQFSLPVFDRFTKKYSDGDVIISEFTKSKSFYFVKSGEVAVEKLINGNMKRYGIVKPGEIFGEMELLEESTRQATVVARGSVSCLKFNKDNFNSVVVNNPVIAMNMLRLVCKRIFEQRRDLKILCIKDWSVRIADVFLKYVEVQKPVGADEEDQKRTISCTIDDISQDANLCLNDTRDELNKYVSRNKIAIYDDRIVIKNIMDMKRTVDSYYANKEEEKKGQKK